MNKNSRITIGIFAVPCLLILLFLVGRGKLLESTGYVDSDSGFRPVMGTFARIVAVATDSPTANKCIEAGFEQLELVDNLMSDYKADSQLSKINREAFANPVKVDAALFKVLQKSLAFSRDSGGAFDITVGPLVDLFRLAEQKDTAPGAEEMAEAKSKTGFEKLQLDGQNRTVKFAVDGMRLDLGGVAKGYAIDKAVQAMQSKGAVGGMVDIGGDIRCFGMPQKGKDKWLIGIQDPNKAKETEEIVILTEPLLILELTDAAVATSGDYRRFTLIEGKKYSHIVDAKTGHSSEGLKSVTIIAESAIEADALATAVSVMGSEKGLAFIEPKPQAEAILFSSAPQRKILKTTGAAQYIKR